MHLNKAHLIARLDCVVQLECRCKRQSESPSIGSDLLRKANVQSTHTHNPDTHTVTCTSDWATFTDLSTLNHSPPSSPLLAALINLPAASHLPRRQLPSDTRRLGYKYGTNCAATAAHHAHTATSAISWARARLGGSKRRHTQSQALCVSVPPDC